MSALRSISAVAIITVVLVVPMACTERSDTPPAVSVVDHATSGGPPYPLRIDPPPPCADGGACEGAFAIRGVVFGVSCGTADPQLVEVEAFAVGADYSAHRLLDTDPGIALAIPGGTSCDSPQGSWDTARPVGGATVPADFERSWCRADAVRPDPGAAFACP